MRSISERRVLVTGAAGFIGQHLVRTLAATGAAVAALDFAPFTNPANGIVFFHCDLLDPDGLARCFTSFSPHIIVHLAARTDLDETSDIRGYAANIEGVRNLLSCAERTSSLERVVVTSSQLVCKIGYVPTGDHEYCPDTLYGASKVETEHITREMDGAGKEWVLVRPTTIWGPGMRLHYLRFFRAIEKGTYFHVGRKALFKSYGFIHNCVHQYIGFLEAPREQIHARVFYLADYVPIDLLKWANAFQKELGAKPIPTFPHALARLLATGGDFFNLLGWKEFPYNSFRLRNILTEYVFDMRPTEAVCGAIPYTMEEGVSITASWLKNKLASLP